MDKFHFEVLQSTQKTAFDIASGRFLFENNLDDFYVISDMQESGIGQRGNLWVSPKGNLYITLCFWHDFKIISILPLVTACLIAEIFSDLSVNIDIKFKWVNDIFVSGKKLGGILIHNDIMGEKNLLRIGIGINFTNNPNFTSGYNAINLLDLGINIDKNLFADKLAQKLLLLKDPNIDLDYYKNKWLHKALFFNDIIKFKTNFDIMEGRFCDISSLGYIGILDQNNQIKYYYDGKIL